MNTPWLSVARRATLAWIVSGGVTFVVIAALGWWAWPDSAPPAGTPERVIAAVMLVRWPALVTIAMVMSLFRIGDTEAALDPFARGESRRHAINQRVLTNTIEQLALFIPALLALAAVASTPYTWRLVSLAVTLFTAGRLLFWIGYHATLNARAIGFQWTFSTTMMTLLASFYLRT